MAAVQSSSITGKHNRLLKQIRRALERGELTEDGLLAIEGPHLVEEARRSGIEIITVLGSGDPIPGTDFISVPDNLLKTIGSTETSPRIIALVRPPRWSSQDLFKEQSLTVVLDGLQDPGNVGTILRSAEAFGASGVLLRPGTVSLYNPKALRASAGSVFRLLSAVFFEPIFVPLFAAFPQEGIAPYEVDWTQKCAIVIGSEAHGISPALAKKATPVRIPTKGVESLNAAVAASILLYEAAKQRGSI